MIRPAILTSFLFATLASAYGQWTFQEAHTTADLRGIHSIGNGVAWASGTGGTVLRTINDGKEWQRCASQGQTADRVLIHIDTDLGAKDLLNNRMAYVAVSRGAHDTQIFTSDREKLPQALSRDVSHQSAHVPEPKQEQIAKAPEREVAQKQEVVAERKAVVEPIEKVYSWPELERQWAPLNNAVTPYEARQFAWKVETGTLQTYQHMGDATGSPYRRTDRPVLSAGWKPHHSQGSVRSCHADRAEPFTLPGRSAGQRTRQERA